MPINPANATELATIAREVGAEVLEGSLRYLSGSWQLGDVDLGEYLDRYRDQRLMRATMQTSRHNVQSPLEPTAPAAPEA